LIDNAGKTTVLAEDLTKVFGKFTAVDRISFQVSEGEIFGFLGPNGAGKTTTIKVLCGLLNPTSGRARVLDWDVAEQPEHIKQHIGYMSQKFSLYEELTVEENVDFFGGIYGLRGDRKRARDQWVLEMAGLTDKRNMITKDLPLGWKQRLALGCALLHEPPVIFLDEPTSGVDPLSRRSFWELINSMADQGVTVFVTTHYMEEAEYCHRLALMSSGKIIALGTPSDLKTRWLDESVIEMDCADLLAAAEILENRPALTEVAVYGDSLHLVTPDPDRALKEVTALLEQVGIQIHRNELISPTLEDVFVTLTTRDAD